MTHIFATFLDVFFLPFFFIFLCRFSDNFRFGQFILLDRTEPVCCGCAIHFDLDLFRRLFISPLTLCTPVWRCSMSFCVFDKQHRQPFSLISFSATIRYILALCCDALNHFCHHLRFIALIYEYILTRFLCLFFLTSPKTEIMFFTFIIFSFELKIRFSHFCQCVCNECVPRYSLYEPYAITLYVHVYTRK